MLKDRPALLREEGFEPLNMKPRTKRLIEALAKSLHWNQYEVVHALVEAEARAQGLTKGDGR